MSVSSTIAYYKGVEKILIAVDCIIFGHIEGQLKLLLFKRKIDPFKNQWSLLGSFVRTNESLHESANRILKEISGISNAYLEQLQAFGGVERDPGNRVISVAYFSLIRLDDDQLEYNSEYELKWFPYDKIPELVLDHQNMVILAIDKLRQQVQHQPLGFELLPKKFTLPQLVKFYSSLYGTAIDDRNFRKKILSLDILIKLDEKDKSTSKKGAYYYSFDSKKYQEKIKDGISMSRVLGNL